MRGFAARESRQAIQNVLRHPATKHDFKNTSQLSTVDSFETEFLFSQDVYGCFQK